MLLFLYDGNPGVLGQQRLILGTTSGKTGLIASTTTRQTQVFNFMCVMEFMRTATEQQKQQQGIKYNIKSRPMELYLNG